MLQDGGLFQSSFLGLCRGYGAVSHGFLNGKGMETNGYFGCIICFEYELNGLLFNEVHVYTIAPKALAKRTRTSTKANASL